MGRPDEFAGLVRHIVENRDDEMLAIIGPNGAGKSSLMNC
jgi:ABC-type branched-subunit amino acid transport system ATPase component